MYLNSVATADSIIKVNPLDNNTHVAETAVTASSSLLRTVELNAWFSEQQVLNTINMSIPENKIVALIGPSGCGKSTFLRCLNRLHEEIPHASLSGQVMLDGIDIYSKGQDPVEVRRHIGMVFQKPNPFPGMSIFENVAIGLTLTGMKKGPVLNARVESALKNAALWEEVKDKLKSPATGLSGGQQQRLCIARALAVNPKVILMDEPTSALDPISTGRIEELIMQLKKQTTIVIVTHNMQQAARVSDKTGFFLLGDLVEYGETNQIFTNPSHEKTENYITGKFG